MSNYAKLNVIDQKLYQDTVKSVFNELGDVLGKTYGPFGSHTLLMNGFDTFLTKDGFTVANSLYYYERENEDSLYKYDIEEYLTPPISKEERKTIVVLSNIIRSLIFTICGRLNNAVGDGTTTAVKVTNAVYQEMTKRIDFTKIKTRPSVVLKAFERIKEELIKEIQKESTPLHIEDENLLIEEIRHIVRISSNDNETITDNVVNAFKAIKHPSIQVIQSEQPETTVEITDGLRIDGALNDKMYEDGSGVAQFTDCNVLMFDLSITVDIYSDFIKPIFQNCSVFGRKLLMLAPKYEEKALMAMKADILRRFNKDHKLDLILGTVRLTSAYEQMLYNDLSILLNTSIITRGHIGKILELLKSTCSVIESIVDFGVNKENYLFFDPIHNGEYPIQYEQRCESVNEEFKEMVKAVEDAQVGFHIGYTGELRVERTVMTFRDLYYNEELYKKILEKAERDYNESRMKYERLGTRDYVNDQLLRRYHTLRMSLATIAVGADTTWKRGFLYTQYEDAVHAAESSYYYGYNNGCGVAVLRALKRLMDNERTGLVKDIEEALYYAYRNVYYDLLSSMDGLPSVIGFDMAKPFLFEEEILNIKEEMKQLRLSRLVPEDFVTYVDQILGKLETEQRLNPIVELNPFDVKEAIIDYSIERNQVYDLTESDFSKDIINSTATDIEVIRAVMELISLLLTGNQAILER